MDYRPTTDKNGNRAMYFPDHCKFDVIEHITFMNAEERMHYFGTAASPPILEHKDGHSIAVRDGITDQDIRELAIVIITKPD